MHKLFSICLSQRIEFSVVGIADVFKKTAKFQGLLNGIPFTEDVDYDKVRARVMCAVKINQPDTNELAS